YLPLWVLAAVGAGVAILVYVAFLFALNASSDPVSERIALLGRDSVPLETRASLPVINTVTLSDILHDDPQVSSAIRESLVQLEEANDRALVRMWGLFSSGEGVVTEASVAIITRIAAGLSKFDGGVQVVGHTDDNAIRTLRFPSNWILSERRAESVSALLAEVLPRGRLASEGRAATQPLVANDSAVNRALNRRIEITLFYAASEL
ncbi:MAG: OmpA family protein, partial [Pseudomonadales bacterium]